MIRWVAAGQDGLRLASEDGQRWGLPQLGKEGETYRSAAFGQGRFVLIGSYGGSNLFSHSADGTTWTTTTQDAQYSKYLRYVGFAQNRFLALGGDPVSVGHANPFLLESSDGQNWSKPRDIAGKFLLRTWAYGDGVYVGVGDRGRRSLSTDGHTWQDPVAYKPLETLIDVVYGAAGFVGVGLHGLRVHSKDGKLWSSPVLGQEGDHLNQVLFTGQDYVAIGTESTYRSRDGLRWTQAPNHHPPLRALYDQGRFVGLRWKGKILTSTDACHWTLVAEAPHHLLTLAVRSD